MRKNLIALYDYADKENINVCYFPLNDSVSMALPNRWICIDTDKIETSIEETVLLAHELGHIETNSFYNIDSKFMVKGQMERKADKWAITHLIPLEKLKKAVNDGLREKWELAERFNVTEDFIVKAIEHYKRKECL